MKIREVRLMEEAFSDLSAGRDFYDRQDTAVVAITFSKTCWRISASFGFTQASIPCVSVTTAF